MVLPYGIFFKTNEAENTRKEKEKNKKDPLKGCTPFTTILKNRNGCRSCREINTIFLKKKKKIDYR